MKRIDVIYMSGRRGGFENILNTVGVDLSCRGYCVRFVQMIDSGMLWTAPEVSFCCLNLDKNDFSFETARRVYTKILKEDEEKPSIIFVAGWPFLNYVAKGASSDADLPIPIVAWLHSEMSFYEEGGCGGMDMLQFSDMCFAINNGIAEDIYKAYPDKVIYRVNNAINPKVICYSEQRDSKKLCYVGRLSDAKAFPFILYAMELTRIPWELEVIGDGEDAPAAKALCEELHLLKRVHFRGWSDKPWHQLTDCRATIISSLYEGGPLSAMEALASGMQVISTPVGVLPETISEGINGFIVPFGEPQALAKVMDRLSEIRYTHEMAVACVSSARSFYPKNVLHDFAVKTDACIKCVALSQRYEPKKKDLFIQQ